ncbi:MAG: RNA polymerase sigma factor [Flavisolibacter sp.]
MQILHFKKGETTIKPIPQVNEKEFNQLFRKYYSPLVYFANGIVSDRETAADIVEDSFVKLWERSGILSKPGSIQSYLYTTVRNAAIDHLRKQKRINAYHAEMAITSEIEEKPIIHRIIEAETWHQICLVLGGLPPKCSQIFRMFYFDGRKLQEIAFELGLSLSTVKSQKVRALKLIKKRVPHWDSCFL